RPGISPSCWLRICCEIACSTPVEGPLHSTTAKGMPLTNSTMSGRRVSVVCSRSTSNSAQTWNTFADGSAQSTNLTWNARVSQFPSCTRRAGRGRPLQPLDGLGKPVLGKGIGLAAELHPIDAREAFLQDAVEVDVGALAAPLALGLLACEQPPAGLHLLEQVQRRKLRQVLFGILDMGG